MTSTVIGDIHKISVAQQEIQLSLKNLVAEFKNFNATAASFAETAASFAAEFKKFRECACPDVAGIEVVPGVPTTH